MDLKSYLYKVDLESYLSAPSWSCWNKMVHWGVVYRGWIALKWIGRVALDGLFLRYNQHASAHLAMGDFQWC